MVENQQQTELLHFLVASLGGFSVDLVPVIDGKYTGDEAKRGFSVGKGRSVRLEDVADIFALDGGRQRRALEAIHQVIGSNVVENDQPNRMLIDGEWHTGPVVDMALKMLKGVQSIAAAALAGNDRPGLAELKWIETDDGLCADIYRVASQTDEDGEFWSLFIDGRTDRRVFENADSAKYAAFIDYSRHHYGQLNSRADRLRDALIEDIHESQGDEGWARALERKIDALLAAAVPYRDPARLRPLPEKVTDGAEAGAEAEAYRASRGHAWGAAFDALREYRLSNMTYEDDGDAYHLVDLLSREGGSIADGECEMISITDEILSAMSKAGAQEVIPFAGLPKRKLDDLVDRGYRLSGFAIQREGQHGFITTDGFVGWWQPDNAGPILKLFDANDCPEHPSRVDAREAARVLASCNGRDLDSWGAAGLLDDSAMEALRALSGPLDEIATSATREVNN